MAYRFKQKQIFPLYNEYFPMVMQSKLITGAFQEAKAITQAPDPMVYLAAMGSVSLALQGLIDVELPIGKICPVSLSMLTIANSGERKSTVQGQFSKGVKLFQKDSIKVHQKKLNTYELELEFYKYKAAQIKKNGLI
jgi:hypothetical protein